MAISYDGLPEHIRGGVQRFIENGIKPGGFLTAVLEGNLVKAVLRADSPATLHATVMWLYREAPAVCFGTSGAMQGWCAAGGLSGLKAREHA